MYRWIEHTSELELSVRAATEEDVLRESLTALTELLLGEESDSPLEPVVSRRVTLEAPDRAGLLAEWLGELAFLSETEGLIPADAVLRLDGERLEATVEGRRGRPRHVVKAVTYHGLRFEPDGEGWHATAVLDV